MADNTSPLPSGPPENSLYFTPATHPVERVSKRQKQHEEGFKNTASRVGEQNYNQKDQDGFYIYSSKGYYICRDFNLGACGTCQQGCTCPYDANSVHICKKCRLQTHSYQECGQPPKKKAKSKGPQKGKGGKSSGKGKGGKGNNWSWY